MRITVIASGSRGDVQPYVALGAGLQRAGHTVRVLSSKDFEGLITDHGLELVDMGVSMEAVANDMKALLDEGNFLKILSAMRTAAAGGSARGAEAGLVAAEGADLIIGGLGGLFTGFSLSEKFGIPFLPAYLYPFTPTREFASVLTPVPQTPLTRWLNRPSHRIAQQTMWQATRSADDSARRDVLRVGRAPLFGPYRELQKPGRPILYGYSPNVIPKPADWSEDVHVTGYWFLEPSPGWEPPAALLDFLASGPPPVFVGFGSMGSGDPHEATKTIVRALANTGRRGIVSAGWGGLSGADLPDTVFSVGSTPYAWLFPRMAAVVHHGGAGTTSAGLRAGVPSIVAPVMGDQPFWARQVHELGVGPKPIARRDLTADSLAESIRIAVADTGMRAKAAALGERIRAEDGIAIAVALIERLGPTRT